MSVDIVKKAEKFRQLIDSAETIMIVGHVHPDGDCIGSNLAMFNYITENYKDKTVDVYDEVSSNAFKILSGYRKIKQETGDMRYDLAISIEGDIRKAGIRQLPHDETTAYMLKTVGEQYGLEYESYEQNDMSGIHVRIPAA